MARFSTSTALYLAAATFVGAAALPASIDLAVAQSTSSGRQSLAQNGGSMNAPSARTHSGRVKSASEQRRQKPTERVEARIKEMHAQLKITPQQEDQWNEYAQVLRDNAQAMQSQIDQRMQNQRNMTAVDNLNSYEQITQTHADGVKKLVPAFEALYNAMSPEQKKNADMVFNRYSQRMAARNGSSTPGGAAGAMQKKQVQ